MIGAGCVKHLEVVNVPTTFVRVDPTVTVVQSVNEDLFDDLGDFTVGLERAVNALLVGLTLMLPLL